MLLVVKLQGVMGLLHNSSQQAKPQPLQGLDDMRGGYQHQAKSFSFWAFGSSLQLWWSSWSSSRVLTSDTPGLATVPSPSLSLATMPTMTRPWLCLFHCSLCSPFPTGLDHYPCPRDFRVYRLTQLHTSLARKTLNSSSIGVRGSISLQVFP